MCYENLFLSLIDLIRGGLIQGDFLVDYNVGLLLFKEQVY